MGEKPRTNRFSSRKNFRGPKSWRSRVSVRITGRMGIDEIPSDLPAERLRNALGHEPLYKDGFDRLGRCSRRLTDLRMQIRLVQHSSFV